MKNNADDGTSPIPEKGAQSGTGLKCKNANAGGISLYAYAQLCLAVKCEKTAVTAH
jgi:hypothetical protein